MDNKCKADNHRGRKTKETKPKRHIESDYQNKTETLKTQGETKETQGIVRKGNQKLVRRSEPRQ